MKGATVKRLCWIVVLLLVVGGPTVLLSGCGEPTLPEVKPIDPALGDPAAIGDTDPAAGETGKEKPSPATP